MGCQKAAGWLAGWHSFWAEWATVGDGVHGGGGGVGVGVAATIAI